jgi:hypothetical protein
MDRRTTLIVLFTASLLALLGGCGRVTIPDWQRGVERYVADTGRGDPNILRDVTLPGTDRRGFALLGHHNPDESTDANGLLLAHRQFAGRPWFVYLIGLVKDEKVREMRLAAMTDTGSTPVWRIGKRAKDSERAYRSYNLEQFRARFPDRRKPPAEYLGFPRAADRLDLQDDGNGHLIATHVPSGARWELNLAAPQKR